MIESYKKVDYRLQSRVWRNPSLPPQIRTLRVLLYAFSTHGWAGGPPESRYCGQQPCRLFPMQSAPFIHCPASSPLSCPQKVALSTSSSRLPDTASARIPYQHHSP